MPMEEPQPRRREQPSGYGRPHHHHEPSRDIPAAPPPPPSGIFNRLGHGDGMRMEEFTDRNRNDFHSSTRAMMGDSFGREEDLRNRLPRHDDLDAFEKMKMMSEMNFGRSNRFEDNMNSFDNRRGADRYDDRRVAD